MGEELLLLHGAIADCGCGVGYTRTRRKSKMVRRRRTYTSHYNRALGRYTRRSHRRRSMRGLGDIGSMGAVNMRQAFNSVKDVLITGAIAAGGAIVSVKVLDMIDKDKTMIKAGYQRDLATAAVGIGAGLIVGKFAKKPKIGAAIAIGAVVIAAWNMLARSQVLGAGMSTVSGLGLVSIERPGGMRPAITRLPVSGIPQASLPGQVPNWLTQSLPQVRANAAMS